MNKFEQGDRVRLSIAGYNQFRHMKMKSDEGVVVGHGRSPHMVSVKVDGRLTYDRYHIDFWEKINGA